MSVCTVCGTACRDKNLMCRYHWFMVPGDQRRDIWRTLQQYEKHPADPNRLTELRAAQRIATAFVRAKLQSRVIPSAALDSGHH